MNRSALMFTACIAMAVACEQTEPSRTKDAGQDATPSDAMSLQCHRAAAGCICMVASNVDASELESGTCSAAAQLEGRSDITVRCCALGSSVCSCTRYGCFDYPGQSACACQLAINHESTGIDACPARSGTTCCLTRYPLARCVCSTTACAAGETTVSSCALSDVARCEDDARETSICQ
jgi:hypothetical protein